MNQILTATHKKENINLLRVRDHFFDKARNLSHLRRLCLVFPVIILAASYLPALDIYGYVDAYRDYYTGIASIAVFFIVRNLDFRIERDLYISNVFREEYDVNVFHIKRNPYIYDYRVLDRYRHIADTAIKDSKKYEYWYEEIFCSDNNKNVLCCQMDNVIYTYYVYRDAKKLYTILLSFIFCLILILWITIRESEFIILSIIALFNILQMFVEYLDVCNKLMENNKFLRDEILNSTVTNYTEQDIRDMQDCIVSNRNKSLFIPEIIRNAYLKDGNPYYNDLNIIRGRYLDTVTTKMPSSSDEISVLSADGKTQTSLTEIHKRLILMLRDVKRILDAADVQYTLDGGTLIGAAREEGRFIFWDDDVDLAIRYEDLAKAREILEQYLADKYVFQDYYNESFYSPRLSNLRIREKNTYSVLEEKDSPLFEQYGGRGLFLDIYVYAPILKSLTVDRMYRMLRIHPLHRKLKRIEDKWRSDRAKYSVIFERYKRKYLKRTEWYLSHAKCDDYYSYTPNYIDNINHPGPYIKREDLYGTRNVLTFEGDIYPVPTNVDAVLCSYYGSNWTESPFMDMRSLCQKYQNNWYSHKKFSTTSLKHLSYADLHALDDPACSANLQKSRE